VIEVATLSNSTRLLLYSRSINRSGLLGGADGHGVYTTEIARCLRRYPNLQVVTPNREGSELSAAVLKHLDKQFPRDAIRACIFKRTFHEFEALLHSDINIVHATDHLIPHLRSVPTVATIHDAIALSHPETSRYRFKKAKSYLFRKSAHWATEIITISEHSKREIVKWFGIPHDKITVTPLGVEEKWGEAVSDAELVRVRKKYALPERFHFFVGTLQPRKNIRRIIDAHKGLPEDLRRDVPLIIAGRHGWKCDSEVAELQNCLDGTMRWIQYVPSEDLLPVFKQATALVWPSLNEGFGLPVLEAFAAGLPVVTSNTTSLPEVAGDAALLVNPESVGEIAEAMRTVVSNESLQNELRTRGRARAKQFTWESTARQTIEVYRKAMESF